MSVKRVFRKVERTPEELAALRREREYFQRERPGPDDCEPTPLPGEAAPVRGDHGDGTQAMGIPAASETSRPPARHRRRQPRRS
jgi:hypothetical protein